MLGPNHTGLGSGVSTMTEGEWSTPLGDVPVDADLAREIADSSDLVDVEDEAHRNEHSIEVQLPFLQFIYPRRFKFEPICMMLQDLKTSIEVGEAIAKAAEKHGAAVLASSDWTHYEPQEEAQSKDKQALEAALQMNEKKFQEIIEERPVSACGYGPVTAMIHAVKLRGVGSSNHGFHVNVECEIPVAAGLGSSASTTVAIIAAVAKFKGVELNKKEIFKLAFVPENFLHGKPSGVDQATCIYGGMIQFTRPSSVKTVRSKRDPVMLVCDTGIHHATRTLVGGVVQKSQRERKDFQNYLVEIREISSGVAKALRKGDDEDLGVLMYQNHELLRKIGVSH